MKKIISIALALMLVLSLAACGTAAKKGATGGADSGSEIVFSELVVVDNAECSIKITGIEPDNMWGYTLNAQLENKSADKTYMFSTSYASINGVQTYATLAEKVAPGKKANGKITFMDDTLENVGIGDYSDIEIAFRVYDSEDFMADSVAEETVHIYPYGEENAVEFVREPQSSDIVLVDNDYATVIATGFRVDELWGYTVDLFLVNKTDKLVMFSAKNASVNGFMADPFYANSVIGGKCAFTSMNWSDAEFEKNGITDVEEIEFDLTAYDFDNILSDPFVEEHLVLNP